MSAFPNHPIQVVRSLAALVVLATGGAAQDAPPAIEERNEIEPAIAEARNLRLEALSEKILAALRNATDADATGMVQFRLLTELELEPARALEIYGGLLDVPSAFVRQSAVRELGETPAEHAEAAAILVTQVLQRPHEKDFIVAEAAASLGRLPASAERVSALEKILEQQNTVHSIRLAAVKALGTMGPQALAALQVVRAQADREDTEMRYAALEAVAMIDPQPENPNVTPKEIAAGDLKASPETFRSLRNSKRRLDPAADQDLRERFAASRDPALRAAVLERLTRDGVDRLAPVAAALQAIGSEDPFLKRRGTSALRASKATDIATRDHLVAALDSENPAVRSAAAAALTPFGNAAAPALRVVIPRLSKVDANTAFSDRGAFLEIVRVSGDAAKGAIPVLLDILPEDSPFYVGLSKMEATYLRAYVMLVIAELGPPDEAFPFIVDGLDNSDARMGHVFAASARAAAALGGRRAELLPLLERALKPDFPENPIFLDSFGIMFGDMNTATSARIEAVRALGAFGKDALPLLPRLKEMAEALNQSSSALKLKAAVDEAIAKIEAP